MLYITEYNIIKHHTKNKMKKEPTNMDKQKLTYDAMCITDTRLISLKRCCFRTLFKMSMKDASLIFLWEIVPQSRA